MTDSRRANVATGSIDRVTLTAVASNPLGGVERGPGPPRAERVADDWWFYRRTWNRTEMPAAASLGPTSWVIFMDPVGVGRQISEQLKGADHQVVEVSPGRTFTRVGKGKYRVRPGCRNDYDSLIVDLTSRGRPPQKIVHLWSVSDSVSQPSVDETIQLSFFSLVHLAQALGDQDLSGVDIAVVSNHLQSVYGEPTTQPVRAALLGPTKVIRKTFPGMTCRSIDCDPVSQGTSYVAVQIIAEHCAPSSDAVVAYRGDERWVEALEQMKFSGEAKRGGIKREGVYLITGGLSDLGGAVAENLARNFCARLVLVDDIEVPASGEWQDLLQRSETPKRIKQAARKLIELQALGSEVMTICADVMQLGDLKGAVDRVRQKFGSINGVVHATGVLKDQKEQTTSQQRTEHVFNMEIKGVLALQDVLREESVDFLALLSCATSGTPPAEEIEYEATSAFLDAFANSRPCPPAVWINLGLSRKAASAEDYSKLLSEVGLPVARIISADTPPAVWVCDDLLETAKTSRPTTKQVAGEASVENVEAVLAGWWQELLGLEQVGWDEDFFELGGHSLIGVQLFSKIEKTYGISLGLATLFEARTIRQLTSLVRPSSDARSHVEIRSWSPLVPIQPKGTRPVLFAISGLGGNVIKFHSLAFHLGEDQPIYGLLPRGLDGKDSYHTRIEDMAADYVAAIRRMQPEGPYNLVGYSFGGIVAFEVAQQIAVQRGRIGLLGLFDTSEWHYGIKADESLRPSEQFDVFKEHLRTIIFSRDRGDYVKRLLSDKYSTIRYRVFHALGRPLPRRIGSIEEMNAYAATGYYPKVYPGKVTLFRSTKRTIQQGNDEFLGWGELAQGGVEVHHIPATHFSILQEPAIRVLAEQLQTCLDLQLGPS